MSYTTDPKDPRLQNIGEDGKQEVYVVLSEEERGKGFIRPLRRSYVHDTCGVETKMGLPLCETYARNPKFYGATYCVGCKKHFAVGQFKWSEDSQIVGS